MKRNKIFILTSLFAVLLATAAIAQQRVIKVYHNNQVIQTYAISEVDSIKVEKVFLAPTNVFATLSGQQVVVTWDEVSDATIYEVYRSGDNANYTLLATDVTETIYTDATPLKGDNYYKVRAIGEAFVTELSEASNVVNCAGNTPSSDFDIFTNLSYDDMVYVEGGTFLMGAQSEDANAPGYDSDAYDDNESPVHSVTVSSFYMGKYEVTQGMWEYVMSYSGKAADGTQMSAYASDVWLGENPSSTYGAGDNYPAYYVSYDDIVDIFLPRLNKITGKTFRLPTDAEWEYAARGGNKSKGYKYSGSNLVDYVAWYDGNSGSATHEVATKQPNELGIYDMSGNVWEWCYDWKGTYSSAAQNDPAGPDSASYRVKRGGGWLFNAANCRVSYRAGSTPSFRYDNLGFRLVCQ